MKKSSILCFLLCLAAAAVLIPATSDAGTISMNSSMQSKDVNGRLGLEVTVKNDGDEAAKSVQVHLELSGEKLTGPLWDTMNAGEKKTETFFFEHMPPKPGTYPVYVTIEFSDLNMYPFTALNLSAFQVGRETEQAQLFAKADALELSKSGTLSITVKNLDDHAKNVTARVLGPRELDIKPMLFELDLSPNSTADRSLEVANFSALPGAGYPIFVIFEYEQGDMHFSHPLVTRVKIAQGGFSNAQRNKIIIIGAAILAAVFLFEVIRRLRKRSSTI
jgi:hypothetical protein